MTFCDIHRIEHEKKKSEPAKPKTSAAKRLEQDKHGFLLNAFSKALKLAERKNQILLVDFAARWCPACVRFESEIFPLAEFKALAKHFVKVKIDMDLIENGPLASRFEIKGIPTLLFLSSKGDEIARLYDYQPLSLIQQLFIEVQKTPQSLTELEKAAKSPSQKELLARRLYLSGQYEKALDLMRPMKPRPKEFFSAQVDLAEKKFRDNPNTLEDYLSVLRDTLKEENQSTRSLWWRQALVENLNEPQKGVWPLRKSEVETIAQDADRLSRSLLDSPTKLKEALLTDVVGEFTGFETFYVATLNAEIQRLAAEPHAGLSAARSRAEKALKRAIDEGMKLKISADHPAAAMRLASAYVEAGRFEEADELLGSLLKSNPSNVDWQARRVNVLLKLKKFKEVIALGLPALEKSYGLNEFNVAANLAEAYAATGEREKALQLARKYLEKNEINFKRLAAAKSRLEKIKTRLLP